MSVLQSVMVSVADFEEYARKHLPKMAFDYYASGADEQQTLTENIWAFKRLRLRPRVLRGVSKVDISLHIQGQEIQMPICIAPTAMHCMAHPDGELATARAASALNTCMVLSNFSTVSLEDVIHATPTGLKWFQISTYQNQTISKALITRAEKAGYKALVLTVDAPIFGRRRDDIRNNMKLPPHLSVVNYKETKLKDMSSVKSTLRSSVTWECIHWYRTFTKLPIIVKGILTGSDAKIAMDYGVDGIIVSNHGARQLDGVPATIDVLPEVVEAVQGRIEVYVDGGIRLGTDILKALALGAQAVFVGRPVIWGLAYQGEEGVKKVLHILREELENAMILSGKLSRFQHLLSIVQIKQGLTRFVQPLDVYLNKPFKIKDRLREKWMQWMINRKKTFTPAEHMRAMFLATICEWVRENMAKHSKGNGCSIPQEMQDLQLMQWMPRLKMTCFGRMVR